MPTYLKTHPTSIKLADNLANEITHNLLTYETLRVLSIPPLKMYSFNLALWKLNFEVSTQNLVFGLSELNRDLIPQLNLKKY